MDIIKKSKSRNQSIFEFFETLQIEWLCANLRTRIYPRLKDKEYWQRVQDGKKQTIENIAEKNKLPTLFTDKDLKAELESRIYRQKGHPIFTYKDEVQRKTQEPLDLLYYYNIGVEVRCELYGEVKVGKIDSYTPGSETINVKIGDQIISFAVDDVIRIL